jgi:hypothetical protein
MDLKLLKKGVVCKFPYLSEVRHMVIQARSVDIIPNLEHQPKFETTDGGQIENSKIAQLTQLLINLTV